MGFWDFNNPDGFHRFVPVAYFVLVALAAVLVAIMAWSIHDRRNQMRCLYPLPHDPVIDCSRWVAPQKDGEP
jgi:hypothetical protein